MRDDAEELLAALRPGEPATYLGVDVDRKSRNDLIKGRSMFAPQADAEVVRLAR